MNIVEYVSDQHRKDMEVRGDFSLKYKRVILISNIQQLSPFALNDLQFILLYCSAALALAVSPLVE